MSATETYARFVDRGCLCGADRIAECPVHTAPNDLRGLRAFFEAGTPGGFPMTATCSICRAAGLLYPNVEIDEPKGSGQFVPTLVCPRCSGPASERALRAAAEAFGHRLNSRSVFGTHAVAA